MRSPGYLLLLLVAGLCALSGGEVLFRCPLCTSERVAACPPPRPQCVEQVRAPVCGCCPVCAGLEGDSCGVYTARCSTGLRCYPKPGSEFPLQALLQGQGSCAKRRDTDNGTSQERWTEVQEGTDNAPDSNMDAGTMATNDHTSRKPQRPTLKDGAVQRERNSEQQKSRIKGNEEKKNPRPPAARTLCQQQLDQVLERILTSMSVPDERGPLEHLYAIPIPNCDKSGLFSLKQCKMSVNGQRGECWCVNPTTGKTIAGAPVIRGDPECHLYYPGNEEEPKQRAQ
ncbi:insulin-like growth factor-binding protein 2 [Gastrophryne carolinensis]